MSKRLSVGAMSARVGILVGLAAATAQGGIVAVSGSTVIANPPANIQVGQWESDGQARIWEERTATLSTPLAIDAVNSGLLWSNGLGNVPGSLAVATPVDSYMLRVDSISNHHAFYDGSVTFDQPVLGLIFLIPALTDSDPILSRPGVTYNVNDSRGLEATDGDTLSLSADRRTLTYHFFVAEWTDDVRIVTAVPAPGAMLLAGLSLPLCLRRRR